mgnify:CR=1 FL=1|jgi:hypothetical protein
MTKVVLIYNLLYARLGCNGYLSEELSMMIVVINYVIFMYFYVLFILLFLIYKNYVKNNKKEMMLYKCLIIE